MTDLGHLPRNGVLNAQNPVTAGAWTVTYPLDLLPHEDFEVWHGFARGPGGTAETWLDDVPYGVLQNGIKNEYAPSIPMFVKAGRVIYVHWSIATGTTPTVVLFFRTPEVGRI